ncbi:hypothetical protein LTR95_004144 [Oleoguttula sp. CCFEE 5521]
MSGQLAASSEDDAANGSGASAEHSGHAATGDFQQSDVEASPYKKVAVLMIEWDVSLTEDRELQDETAASRKVFHYTHRYSVERLALVEDTPDGAQKSLVAKIRAFIK